MQFRHARTNDAASISITLSASGRKWQIRRAVVGGIAVENLSEAETFALEHIYRQPG